MEFVKNIILSPFIESISILSASTGLLFIFVQVCLKKDILKTRRTAIIIKNYYIVIIVIALLQILWR